MTLLRRVLAEKRRIIVLLATAAVGNVLLFALLVFPLGRQVASAEQNAQIQREALRRARQDAAMARATIQGKQQADIALGKFYHDVLPSNASSARGITYRRLSQLANESNLRLVLHLDGIQYASSSALGKLIGLNKALNRTGGELVLLNPEPALQEILSITRLDTVFRIQPSLDSAAAPEGSHA